MLRQRKTHPCEHGRGEDMYSCFLSNGYFTLNLFPQSKQKTSYLPFLPAKPTSAPIPVPTAKPESIAPPHRLADGKTFTVISKYLNVGAFAFWTFDALCHSKHLASPFMHILSAYALKCNKNSLM